MESEQDTIADDAEPVGLIGVPKPTNSVTIGDCIGETLAVIDSDGVFRFTMEANDENTARFVEILEKSLGVRITGVDAKVK